MKGNVSGVTILTWASMVASLLRSRNDSARLASILLSPNESPSTLDSRIRLTFDSPWPLTSAIPDNPRIDWMTESWSFGSAPTTISRSPIVSLLLRALPANCANFTPGIEDILSSKDRP